MTCVFVEWHKNNHFDLLNKAKSCIILCDKNNIKNTSLPFCRMKPHDICYATAEFVYNSPISRPEMNQKSSPVRRPSNLLEISFAWSAHFGVSYCNMDRSGLVFPCCIVQYSAVLWKSNGLSIQIIPAGIFPKWNGFSEFAKNIQKTRAYNFFRVSSVKNQYCSSLQKRIGMVHFVDTVFPLWYTSK